MFKLTGPTGNQSREQKTRIITCITESPGKEQLRHYSGLSPTEIPRREPPMINSNLYQRPHRNPSEEPIIFSSESLSLRQEKEISTTCMQSLVSLIGLTDNPRKELS